MILICIVDLLATRQRYDLYFKKIVFAELVRDSLELTPISV